MALVSLSAVRTATCRALFIDQSLRGKEMKHRTSTMNETLKTVNSFLLVLYYWIEGLLLCLVPRRFLYKNIAGEVALVTGAGSGIGRLMALKFARKGAVLVLWDINGEGNAETAEMIRKQGGQAIPYQVDITDKESVYKTAAKVKDEVGIVTLLVNNAGIVVGRNFTDLPDHLIEKTFEVNALSHFWIIKAFLPDMLSRNKGHFVTISSLAGLGGIPKLTDYCASKFAAVGLTEALSLELYAEGRRNIYTTLVCPYFINTGMFAGASSKIFRMLSPEYVADEIVSAVLSNQSVVIIPRVFYLIYPLKTMLPVRALLQLYEACGGFSSMTNFTGRQTA